MTLPSVCTEYCHRALRVHALWILTICACPLVLGLPASAQSNALTLPRNLGELVLESHAVVQGRVTSVTLEPHPQLKNLLTVAVTLQVEETLKGDALKSFTFRQAIIDARDRRQSMGYRTGQHLLLILMKPSSYGLTSPAGMEQGRFRIDAGHDGKLLATNGFNNAGLFRGLDSQLYARSMKLTPGVQAMVAKPQSGPVSLEDLKIWIRMIAPVNLTQ